MPKIARDYEENVQTIIQSALPSKKKKIILESIVEQLYVLCESNQVPDLTEEERLALQKIYSKTRIALHTLKFNRKLT